MISNDECEILGRIQKLTDDGIPGECYMYSITGVKNKRVILLPNDSVTFSVAVGLNYSKRAVNIVLENEIRKGKVETVKGQVRYFQRNKGQLVLSFFCSSLDLLISLVKKTRRSSFIIQKSMEDTNYDRVMKWNFTHNITSKVVNHVRIKFDESSRILIDID